MKVIASLFVMSALLANADTRFVWDANPEADVCEYRLYVGSSPRVYTQVINPGCNLTVTIPRDYGYAAVTAVNFAGLESDFSREVEFFPQMRWQLPAGQVLIETCDNLTFPIWLIYAVVTGPTIYDVHVDKREPQRFFRYSVLP